jgi:hypothetical protein
MVIFFYTISELRTVIVLLIVSLKQIINAEFVFRYGLDDREVGVRVPVGTKILFFHVVQTGSEAHPASY